ncbi:MAG: uroporphyrinogen-III C-methyltransferase [Myxococcota bacterium]
MSGSVVLVGAGPGDPDLLTVRAARELECAEVLLYDALIDPELLERVPRTCERIDVGKRGDGSKGVRQEEIAALMIDRARQGRRVVRLKGGDPFVFGRGGEEASALAAAGVPFEVVPGISSALAVPAYAGIPLTDRRSSSSFAVITGHRGKARSEEQVDWEGLARSAQTLVILMGTAWLERIVERVIEGGRDPATPVAVIERGSGPRQRVVVAPLSRIAEEVRSAGLEAPTVIVVGEVVRLREALAWYEARPLFSRRVLVTREVEDARGLLGLLRRRGAEAVHVPLLAFEPAQDPGPLDRALEKLEGYDWLVFTSSRAVRAVIERLEHLGLSPNDLAQVRVGCVGQATEELARGAGIHVEFVPEGGTLPELMADELARHTSLDASRILFPRAREGRDLLRERLSGHGAVVDLVEAYCTVRPATAQAGLDAAVRAGLDAVTLLSPSAVHPLVELLDRRALEKLASEAVFACIGPTTAAALREHGVEPELVCETQTVEALVEALDEHFGRRLHGVSP